MSATDLNYACPAHWMTEPVRVCLIGVGGTGSEVLDGLARMHHGLRGLGHPHGLAVTVYDADTVSESNVGRQRFSPADVGRNKAITLVHRYNLFYGLDWDAQPAMLEPEADLHTLSAADLILTCVDQARFRADLGLALRRQEQPEDCSQRWYPKRKGEVLWLDFGNGRHTGQAVLGHALGRMPQGGLRLPNVFDLYPELDGQNEDDSGPSCSLAAALAEQDLWVNKFASMALALLWTLLTQGRIDRHGCFFDSAAMSMRPLMIDPQTWAMMGVYESKAAAV